MRILLSAIYPYIFLLLYLLIPFDNYIRALPNILIAVMVVIFPFIVRKNDFQKLRFKPIAFFAVFFVFLCLNSFIADRFAEDFNIIKKILIALGLAILYIPISDIQKIKGAIIFSSLAAIAFSIYHFMLITDATGSFALGDSPQVVEALLIDRLYLGLLCVFSILISATEMGKNSHSINNYHLANISINLLFLILIASKIAIVALLLLVLIRQFYGSRKTFKIFIALGAIVLVVGLFMFIRNESLQKKNIAPTQHSTWSFVKNSMTYELRTVVWKCSADIIKDLGITLTGVGFEETESLLVSCYGNTIENSQKREEFIQKEYNTHNQFLDFYISAGFLSLLLFVVFILVSFLFSRRYYFPIAMLSLLGLYCLVENIFHRQIGAYYMGFILIVLMAASPPRENKLIKEL